MPGDIRRCAREIVDYASVSVVHPKEKSFPEIGRVGVPIVLLKIAAAIVATGVGGNV